MKIEKRFYSSCSEYSILLHDLTEDQRNMIKELENDLEELGKWQKIEKKKLPKEPKVMDKPGKWGRWSDSKKVKKFHKEVNKKWGTLKRKYRVNKEDIFDTSIWGFHWSGKKTLEIFGYLNEGNFVEWLDKVVKVNKMIVKSN